METATEDTQKESANSAVASSSSENAAALPPPTEQKKSKKEDRTKREDKNLEQFMKSLNSIPTLEEKLSLVCKKYVQTADENKKMQFYIKQSDKRYALLLKEKEQLQLEFNKTVLVKSKLENLCRELQKQNKAIKEESLLKIREEEERRKETQAKFQTTLTEITTMLQQNNEKNTKLRDDNITMTEKFKGVVTQYQLREQQVDKMAKQMALENQLSEAKMQKASLEHQADKERLLSEMEQLKVTVATYRAKVLELQGIETNLRSQLAVYTDKYDEFQNALVKSNQMFGGFKEQMDMMSKKIKKLEKESLSWKTRWETSQTALLDMCSERQAGEARAAAAARQLAHMQGLCRTLQAERSTLLATLKEHNIERPPLPPAPAPPSPAPATPPPAPASNAKVDAMAANCAQLRQSLAHLQSQLNVLTNKQKEESPKPEVKPEESKKEKKKSKSKKNKAEKKAESNPPKEESDVTDDNLPNTSENTSQDAEKVDEATLENLIQAINNANINLCDLEVVSDEIAETVKANPELIVGIDVQTANEETPKIEEECPKIDEINLEVEELSPKIEELSPKVEELSPKVTEVISKSEVSPKIEEVSPKIEEVNLEVEDLSPKVGELSSEVTEVIPKIEEVIPKIEKVNKEENSESTTLVDSSSNVTLVEPSVESLIKNTAKDIVNDVANIKNDVTSKAKIEVKETNLTIIDDANQNVSIVESSNDEISHINEVKPILNNA